MAESALSLHFLPEHHFAETHRLFVRATPARALDAVAAWDPGADLLVRTATGLRELPDRLLGLLGFASGLKWRRTFGLGDFLLLGREADRDLAYGLSGRFWKADYGLLPQATPADFRAFDEPESAKLVMSFTATPVDTGVVLETQTRVFCTDAVARRKFLPYWLLIRPVSGLIRRRILGGVRKIAEAGQGG